MRPEISNWSMKRRLAGDCLIADESTLPGRYRDNARGGGALLDLYLHSADFFAYAFGMPKAAVRQGCAIQPYGIVRVSMQTLNDDIGRVTAEGRRAVPDGFAFNVSFCISFGHASVDFDLDRPGGKQLALTESRLRTAIELLACCRWGEKIRYSVECVVQRRTTTTVTQADAFDSNRLLDAEQ